MNTHGWLISKSKTGKQSLKLTGADVTVMPNHMFHTEFKDCKKPVLKPVSKSLLGLGYAAQDVLGDTNMLLQKDKKQSF